MPPSKSKSRRARTMPTPGFRPKRNISPSSSWSPTATSLTLNDIFSLGSPISSNDNVDDAFLTPTCDASNDLVAVEIRHSPSPSNSDTINQLVNDHNLVGPGHDIMMRPFVCPYSDCNKAFARKSDLARHNRIHTGDRPFVCTMKNCGKSFIQRSALTVHIRTHTGEKPHICETCEKPFADSSSLARHRRIHTGTRPYSCREPNCNRSFARRNTYLKHFKRQHPGLPAPSTNTSKHTVHYPVKRRTFLAPGPPGPNGQPQYYVETAASTDTNSPHGNAASHPPQGAAYAFNGGYPGSYNGHPSFVATEGPKGGMGFGGRTHVDGARVGTRVGGGAEYLRTPDNQSQYFSSAASIESTSEATSNVQTVHTPLTPTSSFANSEAGGESVNSPSTPFQGGQSKHDIHTSIARSASGPVGVGSPQYPFQPTFSHPSHSLPPPPPGMMWFKTDNSSRSVSAPNPRPYHQQYNSAPFGGVGGGFMPGQLALPPQHHQQFQPPLYRIQTPQKLEIDTGNLTSEMDEDMREDTPEPLVDISSLPQISFYPPPPANTPVSGPYSAVDPSHFNPLTHGPPQISIPSPHPGRLHSAPPFLHRVHSQPSIPTMSSWSDAGPYQGPGGYGDAHSIGGGRSGEDEEWAELEEQMISRDVSVGPEEQTTSAQQPQEIPEITPMATSPMPWGAPIAYPQPPSDVMQRYPFSSAASSTSTSTTLVGPSDNSTYPFTAIPQPISIYPQHAPHAMAMTPITPHGYCPTPTTPWSAMSHEGMKFGGQPPFYSQYMLASPAVICRNPNQTLHPTESPQALSHGDVHHITLTTPPKQLSDSRDGIAQVGLGIANVHFDDRSKAIAEGQWVSEETQEGDQSEAESALDEDEEDEGVDAGADDDSDDDFVPGGRKKSTRRKGGKAGRGKGWSARSKKRV